MQRLGIQRKSLTLPHHSNNKCVNIFKDKLYTTVLEKHLKCHGPKCFVSCNMLLFVVVLVQMENTLISHKPVY